MNLTEIMEKYENSKPLNDEEWANINTINHICDLDIFTFGSSENISGDLLNLKNNFAYQSFASIVGQKKNFLLFAHEIITSEGVCYSINMLDQKDLYKEDMTESLRYPTHGHRSNWTVFGYPDDDPWNFPLRIIGSSKEAGITLVLKIRRKDIDRSCRKTGVGYRLTLHTPDEIPRTGSQYYKIPLNAETIIAIQPRVMSTSDNLIHYAPEKRQCYFREEKVLRFFKSYTQSNCKLECLASKFILSTKVILPCFFVGFIDFTFRKCNCVKFSMPHSNGTRICNLYDKECLRKAELFWILIVSVYLESFQFLTLDVLFILSM